MRSLPLVIICAGFSLPALAETQIRAVTLSTAGLAMIEAQANLGADGLRLPVRRADIDDFLKSLRLSDLQGRVPLLTLTGPGGLQDSFDALPFDAAALTNLRALMDAMIGAPVAVSRRGLDLEGRIMGTRDVPCTTDGQQGCVALALRTDTGQIRQVLLDDATEVSFSDDTDSAALGRGLDALRAAGQGHMLDVQLNVANPGSMADADEISLAWLQSAPVWKTAWRAETGPDGTVLDGWAVVENATGHDWQDVQLTLATGAVQALQAQLYDRQHGSRKLAAPMLAESAVMASAPMERSMGFDAAYDVAPVAMDDGDSFSRFTLSPTVTLSAGDMISLPFLRETLDDARLTIFRGGTGARHPMIAIVVENPLPLRLPAGIMTLYDAGRGHAGDAMIPELAPGDTEIVEFAHDTAVSLREDVAQTETVQSARIVDGVMLAEERLEQRTTYHIEGAAQGARVLTIAHPLRQGWQIGTEGGTLGLDDMRFTLELEEGELTTHEVVEHRRTARRIALLDLDLDTLGYWSTRLAGSDMQNLLTDMQELRAEEAGLQREIARLQDAEATLIADQERLVGLIVQLGDDSPASRDRRARVDAIEAEIDTGRAAITAAETRMETIRSELRALIRNAE
ncbi:hypothetical protein [Roseinatronobacter alkalisoli]|uniref:DUF4139 domain-containing protein n=1 Tax=Roseinatronobacter alkalisoli TaxID=3028235 RepID=A0ABT5T951_9RHOB|nr:hypothetical protein [Roseinatronobacter sp. HJB301]MDD7971650.1 hypothetical protein [Roseinatronobacter sp. HJB301]